MLKWKLIALIQQAKSKSFYSLHSPVENSDGFLRRVYKLYDIHLMNCPYSEPTILLFDLDVNTLIDSPLAFVIHHLDLPDFRGVRDVRTAIRLQVKPDDLDCADLGNSFRKKIDLCTDQVWDLKCFVARQYLDPNFALLLNLMIHRGFDIMHQFGAHRFEFEIHSTLQGIHIAASHLCTIVAKDRAAQNMERCMGTHQLMSPRPVQSPAGGGVEGRQWSRPAKKMQNIIDLLLNFFHRKCHALNFKRPKVTRLTTSARIKGGTFENHSA